MEPGEHVQAGNELAEKVRRIMSEIAESALGTKSTMEEMLSCAEEQSRGIEQVRIVRIPAFFKVVVAFCNKITSCRFFLGVQIHLIYGIPVANFFTPAFRMLLAGELIDLFSR